MWSSNRALAASTSSARITTQRRYGSSTQDPPGSQPCFLKQSPTPAPGSDFTYSTWRKFPLRDPADFTIPANEGAFLFVRSCQLAAASPLRCGAASPGLIHRRPPVVSSEKFHRTGSCLKRILSDMLAAPAEIDKLRKLEGRPRLECWVRHDWRAMDIAPGAIEMPGWMERLEGLSGEEAAARMAAMRVPMSGGAYLRLRMQERAERDRKALEEARGLYAPVEAAAQAEARAPGQEPANQESHTPAPTPPAAQESDAGADAPPSEMTIEQIRAARERKARMSKATQQKVEADRKDAASAASHAKKVVARMEREGRL